MSQIIEQCDNTAERLMAVGRWDEARNEYISCRSLEASELTLRVATLEWRRDCAQYIAKNLYEPCPLQYFIQDITSRYDSFAAEWMVRNYQGIKIVESNGAYNVIRRNG